LTVWLFLQGNGSCKKTEIVTGVTSFCLLYRLVYMEVLTFRQQLEAYAKAQVLVMGHGAAFANIMFMAPVSFCLCTAQVDEPEETHAACCI